MVEDFERCYRAVQSRDPRFDGWFVTAVTSTGIYCRPSCPARTPKPAHVRFFATAAAAQTLGFRACLRCRPDAAPGSPEWNVRQDTVGRAMRLIADGVVERDGVAGLARRLGYGPRQLHRLLVTGVGAGPLALARTQRANAARVLVETTALPMADVAFAAGFASVRQFNDTVRAVFGRNPSSLRRQGAGDRPSSGACAGGRGGVPGAITLRLPYRRPMALDELLGFLGRRTVPGVEASAAGRDTYRRTLRLPHGHGTVALEAGDGHAVARVNLQDLRDLGAAVGRCRRLLDLDADPEAVDGALGADPLLGPLVRRTPGRRVPGAVDGFELAVRAVAGQQVSVAGARTVVARLVSAAGPCLEVAGEPAARPLSHVFPTPEELLDAPDGAFAMPHARREALRGLASAMAAGTLVLDVGAAPDEARRGLMELPGIGEWTASYVSMRALGDPDAFMGSDLGIRRALSRLGFPGDRASVDARTDCWRPWRAYAAAHLWAMDAAAAPRAGRRRARPGGTPERGAGATSRTRRAKEDAA